LKAVDRKGWVCAIQKAKVLHNRTKHYFNVNKKIKYEQKYKTKATKTKLLGLITDDTVSWKQYIDQVVSKMCADCLAT
jgi:hypothetical protein